MRRKLMFLAGLTAAISMTFTAGLFAASGSGKKAKAAKTIAIPGDAVYPEGIAAKGQWIYTGSSQDGTIYRAPKRGAAAEVLSPAGADGRTAAIGMKVDKQGHLLVAGGATGKVFVLDRATGATLGVFTNAGAYAPGGPTFLNDIAIAKNGDAFVTDSFAAVIYRIPAAALAAPVIGGTLEAWLLLEGSPITYQDGFNLNGIVAYKNKYLAVVQANTGKLYRIRVATKQITEIRVKKADLNGGDGMVLVGGRELYVVNGGEVDVLKLDSKFRSAKLRRTITSSTFDSPTTAAIHDGRLYVVNSQFGKLFANPPVAPSPFTVSVLKPNQGRH